MGTIVTFYSYKGGTGRSMALANVAWVLTSNGARVLVVDWDLEAPGLHRYFRPFLADKELTRLESQGVIDLMGDFVGRLATPEDPSEPRDPSWYREHADISKWSKRLLWPSGEDARTGAGGTIDFVPAGRQGPQYAKKVNSFDWAGFYDRCNGGAFLDAMRRSMGKYDWVLIDSRTGVSDTSGICTVQLPDVLVVCFTLNYQSIEGASAVAASAQVSRKRGELRILPLPTRLDGNEERLLKAMMAYARRTFSPLMPPGLDLDLYWKEIGVPYFSRYAYSEKLAPFEEQVNVSTSTLPSMERLTAYITDRAVTKLKPLPDEPRADALAEFEQLPDAPESGLREPMAEVGWAPRVRWSIKFIDLVLTQLGYQFRSSSLLSALAVGVSALVIFGLYQSWFVNAVSPATFIPALVTEARSELKAGQRDHAALLIAEAAARLDPATVVGPVGDPARQVYEAFLLLQPLQLQKAGGAIAPGRARTVLISPNGRWVAVTGPTQETRLFRFPPQAQTRDGELRGYSAGAFSPDSRYLASGGRNGSLIVSDTATGREVWRWDNKHSDAAWLNAVAFSPNGNLVAAGTDTGEVLIAKVEAWTEFRIFPPARTSSASAPSGQAILSLAFSPDSTYLAAGGESRNVRLLTYKQDTPVEVLGPHSGAVRTIKFVPDPPYRAAAAVAAQQRDAPLPNPIRVATASGDGFVHLWTRTEGVTLRADIPVGPDAYAVAFSQDGRAMATGGKETHVWWLHDLKADNKDPVLSSTTLDFGVVRSLTVSADGTWLVVGGETYTSVWDMSGYELERMYFFRRDVLSVALSPDKKYVVAATDDGGLYAALVQIKGHEQTLPASQVQELACSQTAETVLSAAQWKHFFGSDPIRFTCGRPAEADRPSARD